MALVVLQIAAVFAIALVLVGFRKSAKRRNSQSWDALLARLRPEWSARELSDHFLWQEGLSATPEDAWQRMEGPKGLWVIYQNARVMQEMADFAAKNCDAVDRLLIETLHSDAMQIRVCVLTALGQYAFRDASEVTCFAMKTPASAGVFVCVHCAGGLEPSAAGLFFHRIEKRADLREFLFG